MYKIDNDTALTGALPAPTAPGPNVDGHFTGGNPGAGTPATIVDAEWLNMVQEEMANAVTGAGLALDKASRTQLFSAIKALVIAAGGAYIADTGAANAYVITPTNAPPAYAGGETFKFVPANANTGAATLNRNGLGAKAIVHPDGTVLRGGDIPALGLVEVTYQAALGKYILLTTTTNIYAATSPGYVRIPGTSLVIQWVKYSISSFSTINQPAAAGTKWGQQTVNWPLTFNGVMAYAIGPSLTNNNNYLFAGVGEFNSSDCIVYATCWDDPAVGQPQVGYVIAIGAI